MSYAKLIAILFLPLAFVVFYAYSPVQIPPPGWTLRKIETPSCSTAEDESPSKARETRESRVSRKSRESREPREPREPRESSKAETLPDTTSHRILFFGDSMVEGLLRRMNSYAFANGHQMTNIVWYGSTTELWAHTDTLRHFLEKVKPTFVMISIGSNEQFIKDVAGREACIRHIISQLGATPFVWIGVPAWRTDTGINELTRQTVGKSRYFDSRGLTLQRGSDRRHPTFSAASLWMDSIARWMASPETAHPIRMNKPTDRRRHSYKTYILQPLKN